MDVAEHRHQHLVGLIPLVLCTGLWQAQAPEALVVEAQGLLDVSQGHVKWRCWWLTSR